MIKIYLIVCNAWYMILGILCLAGYLQPTTWFSGLAILAFLDGFFGTMRVISYES